MPQPKSMANQEALECSGRESSGPRRMLPYLLKAMKSTNTTKAVMASMYSQAKFTVTASKSQLAALARESEKKMPQTASTTQITREARYTGLSFPAFPFLEPLI